MKTLSIISLCLMLALSGCKKSDDAAVTPTVTKPDYQLAIEAKYKALGWTEAADNGGVPLQTIGKKGYVQYYGAKERAIYYFNGNAFSVMRDEVKKYDAIGQDNAALITSDSKVASPVGLRYNDIALLDNSVGVLVTAPTGTFLVYGVIYQEYLRLSRWDGKMGFPTNDESTLTTRKEGRWNSFQTGQIYWSPTTGAHAFWGKVETLYRTAGIGYDGSWLGLPTSSCDPTRPDDNQLVQFQNGQIQILGGCGKYKAPNGDYLYQNGQSAKQTGAFGVVTNPDQSPCYK